MPGLTNHAPSPTIEEAASFPILERMDKYLQRTVGFLEASAMRMRQVLMQLSLLTENDIGEMDVREE